MLRPEQLLYPQRVPVTPLQASTLLLLRENPEAKASQDWQVLMTLRSEKASFVPGHYVFPGGGIEPHDATAHAQVLCRPDMPAQELTAAIAAVRESFEEMGLLLAVHTDGRPVVQADVDQLDRHAPLWPQLQTHGLRLDVRGVWQLAHWTADRDLPRRFAVPFFVARAPQAQIPVADESEQFEPVWVRPAHALQQHAAGQMPMIFPTIRTLERLARYTSVQAILDALTQEPIWQSCPRSGLLHGQLQRFMEDEAPYGELALVCPDGQVLHALEWQSTQAVPLRKNLWRLTAPNANVMTGPGTNSYLVGEASTGYIAIDPGPADEAHIHRLFHAAGGDIRHIVCTHSHADHSPGALILQALCVAQGHTRPLIYGIASATTARPNSYFVPDKAVYDGECVTLSALGISGNTHCHTLRVIHTPGHAANHICLLLQEDALLFTGDHILNGSTPVIDTPDGNMADYLDSLDKLDGICVQYGVEFLLPAHGYVLGDGRAVIARLKAHRLARESKIIAAMRQKADGSLQDWVASAYADTPASLWPLAERSLKAHIERIKTLGLLQD